MLDSMLTKAPKLDCGAITSVKCPVHFRTIVARIEVIDQREVL